MTGTPLIDAFGYICLALYIAVAARLIYTGIWRELSDDPKRRRPF